MYKVYSKSNCSSCVSAKQLLEQKGLEYEVLMFGKDYDLGDMLKICPSNKTFPLITLNNEYIGGLNSLQQLLNGDKL
ncbi:MAG: glutaredoxin [Erysipelotrichaceae bacterium]